MLRRLSGNTVYQDDFEPSCFSLGVQFGLSVENGVRNRGAMTKPRVGRRLPQANGADGDRRWVLLRQTFLQYLPPIPEGHGGIAAMTPDAGREICADFNRFNRLL